MESKKQTGDSLPAGVLEGLKFTDGERTFEIYSVRRREKVYFWNTEDEQEQYNAHIEELERNLGTGVWTSLAQ